MTDGCLTNYEDVLAFHLKFGLGDSAQSYPFEPGPRVVSCEWLDFRIKFLEEELQEFKDGIEEEDDVQAADALVDLVSVALGTAIGLGYPWQELWNDVQAANMRKVNAASDGSDSKRGYSFDVVKPHGWVGPNGEEILRRHGFNV